ncbi:MAG: DUF899 domain-containing protein [Solirubrobacteraceae bacterium]
MPVTNVATRQQWEAAREALLTREKQLTRMSDELARERQELPWVPVEKPYVLQTERGEQTLAELFDGRSQLVVYNFMFGPDYEAGCPVCSSIADSFDGVVPLLAARDVTMICISRAPLEKLLGYRQRMGWSFTWASSHESDFNQDFGRTHPREEHEEWARNAPPTVAKFAGDCGTDAAGYVSERPGLHVFARDGDDVYLTYLANSRGLEPVMTYYGILDRVPRGRAGEPSDPGWLRRHDELGA